MEKRISFPEFEKELLFWFAVLVGADFAKPATAVEAASLVKGRYPESWIDAVASNMVERGCLEFRYNTNADTAPRGEFPAQAYSLTQDGLREAMQQGRYTGYDLWGEIGKLEDEADIDMVETGFVPQGPVRIIDKSSELFRDLEREIRDTVKHVESSNALKDDPTASRRLSEIRAGTVLLEADHIDVGLLKRVLLPALNALMKMIGNEAAKQGIRKAIELLIRFMAGA